MEEIGHKPQRLRFSEHENIQLLREIVQENPFQDPTRWERIQRNLQILTGKTYLIKTLKNRIERLLEQFIKNDERDQKRSGIEEPQTENDQLLCEIAILASEYKGKKTKKVSKEQQISEIGKQVRARYAENLKVVPSVAPKNNSENLESLGVPLIDHCYVSSLNAPLEHVGIEVEIPFDHMANNCQDDFSYAESNRSKTVGEFSKISDPLTDKTNISANTCDAPSDTPRRTLVPSRKRQRKDPALKKSCLNYLTEKQEKDREIKLKEIRAQEKKLELEERRLSLEEKKLSLEEKKIEFELKEKELKLKIEEEKVKLELEDRRIATKLLTAQQIIIDNFCKSLYQNP